MRWGGECSEALVGSVEKPGGLYFTPRRDSETDSPVAKNTELRLNAQTQFLLVDGESRLWISESLGRERFLDERSLHCEFWKFH